MATFLWDGFLLKKRSDAKKSLMGSSKYQRRFFKLTTEEIAYASCAKDFKGAGGRIEVFPLNELMWVRRREKVKISMKFPGRMLRVKAEDEGSANQWFKMLEEAREQFSEEIEAKYFGPNSPGSQQQQQQQHYEDDNLPLEHSAGSLGTVNPVGTPAKKKYMADVRTIEMDSDSSEDEKHVRQAKMAQSSSMPHSFEPMADINVAAANAPSGNSYANRPPSPRSLLANARTGRAHVKEEEEDNRIMLQQPSQTPPSASGVASRRRSAAADEQLVLDGPGTRVDSVGAPIKAMAAMGLSNSAAQEEVLQLGGGGGRYASPAIAAPKPLKPGRIELGEPSGRPGFSNTTPAEGGNGNWLEEDFDSSDDEGNNGDDGGGGSGGDIRPSPPQPVWPSAATPTQPAAAQRGGHNSKSGSSQAARQPSPGSPVATGGVADANFAEDDWDEEED